MPVDLVPTCVQLRRGEGGALGVAVCVRNAGDEDFVPPSPRPRDLAISVGWRAAGGAWTAQESAFDVVIPAGQARQVQIETGEDYNRLLARAAGWKIAVDPYGIVDELMAGSANNLLELAHPPAGCRCGVSAEDPPGEPSSAEREVLRDAFDASEGGVVILGGSQLQVPAGSALARLLGALLAAEAARAAGSAPVSEAAARAARRLLDEVLAG